MLKTNYIFLLLLTCRISYGQNLVPNPSFEIYDTCPSAFTQLSFAIPWFQPTSGTPDYFNSCDSNLVADVPNNYFGTQNARYGIAYAGIYTYQKIPLSYREYLEVRLFSPLITGITYYAEFFVSLADSTDYATDGIGGYFSVDSVLATSNFNPLPYIPQISNSAHNVISDKLNWTRVSGQYVAMGGEEYFTIGNFNDNNHTDTLLIAAVLSSNYFFRGSYYYLDDVCVSTDSINCLVLAGIEQPKERNISLFPNPFDDKLNVAVRNSYASEIFLYDIIGGKLLGQKFTNSISLNTEQLAKGIYLYQIKNKTGVIQNGKIIKE